MNKNEVLSLEFESTEITCPIEEGHRMIPIRTICNILGVDYRAQHSWLKNHKYYGQLVKISSTVGADGKTREMNCLPFFDVLSWVSAIAPRNRADQSLELQFKLMVWLRTQMLEMYKLVDLIKEENAYELELIEYKGRLIEQKEEHSTKVAEINREIKKVDTTIADIREKRFTGQTAIDFSRKKLTVA